MAIQIDGNTQTPQQQTRLDNLQLEIRRFVEAARRVTERLQSLMRKYNAMSVGDDLGAAASGEYVTDSNDSRLVSEVRKQIKAVASYAVIVGALTETEANAVVQEAYGNSSETVVAGTEIKGLTDEWV